MMSTTPALMRAAPFGAFIAALALRGTLQGSPYLDSRWLYLVQVVSALTLMLFFRHAYSELRQQLPLRAAVLAIGAGLLVFWVWIHATMPWMSAGAARTADFDAVDEQGQLRWDLIALRLFGAVLIVPVMEELFWRSFLMRWIDQRDFLALAPQRASAPALLISSAVFASAHQLWLAGLFAGLFYGWLYRRTANLWFSILAHASTNLVLGLWVIDQRAWSLW